MPSNDMIENEWSRRTKFLSQALIISAALNVGLLATFFYSVIKDKQTSVAFEHAPAASAEEALLSNDKLLLNYSTLSFSELLSLLENQDAVQDGYKKRDLALASLAAFHHFNLEKALGTPMVQKRQLSFVHEGQERVDLVAFPGLKDDQFQAILHYAKTEKWPLTSEGLFFEIKGGKMAADPSLLEAFYLTPEFHTIATLFARSGLPLQREGIVDLLKEGDWPLLKEFADEQKQAQDLSPSRLCTLLLKFFKKRSVLAAKILLDFDREFIVRRLEDADLLLFLDLLNEKTPKFDLVLKELLFSPRTDAIWKKAGEKLYTLAGLPVPSPYDHGVALRTFFPPPVAAHIPTPKEEPSLKKTYIVQQGDNLWKIARKHRVSVDALKKKNHLESEKLKVGKELEIP